MSTPSALSSHLGDFETTTSHLLRSREALALLNFAALLHEVVYLPDTALGDHQLILESFHNDPHGGVFGRIRELIEAGILVALCRNRVVVSGKVLTARQPTIRDIHEGWMYRQKEEWRGESVFTADIDSAVRDAYYREIDNLLDSKHAIYRYDPDVTKAAFRDKVLDQLDRPQSSLTISLGRLPHEVREAYVNATRNAWFTNGDLWRVLRSQAGTTEPLILQAHINQQCLADITMAGQSGYDRAELSLASFNIELQRRKPLSLDIEATIQLPPNLRDLLDSAPVRLSSPGLDMFARLPVEKIVELRNHAAPIFKLARTPVREDRTEEFHGTYLKALESYWLHIVGELERLFPERMRKPRRAALFLERNLPTLSQLWQRYGRSLFTMVFRITAPPEVSVTSGVAAGVLHHTGVVLLHERTDTNQSLRNRVPPPYWRARGILGLDTSP